MRKTTGTLQKSGDTQTLGDATLHIITKKRDDGSNF